MADAIRKITSLPAARFSLTRSGRLQPGFDADVTVFDPRRIGSAATYENPKVPPDGIVHVFRRGRLMLRQGAVLN
jgi:N-acyl-D-aspartate/D-glutamate deacylase